MGKLVADANLCFSVACEGDTGVQQEHIAMEMLVFWCTEKTGIFNEWWSGIERQRNALENPQINETMFLLFLLFMQCLTVVMQLGFGVECGLFVWLFLFCFPGTILLYHAAEHVWSSNHLQGCFQISPL